MKFIKNNKLTVLVIVAFIVLVVVLFLFYNLFFSNSKQLSYGNRLDGIEEVLIDDATLSKISTELKKDKNVKEVTANISGRTLEIIITVADNVSINDAKKISNNSYSSLNDKQTQYYSVQVFVKKTSQSQNDFPIIGYKQKGTKNLVWTKDRKVTSNNEK